MDYVDSKDAKEIIERSRWRKTAHNGVRIAVYRFL